MSPITSEQILSSEISAFEEMLAKSSKLKERIAETTAALEVAYSGVITSKHVFEEIKKENIEELRLFRQTVVRECGEIVAAVKQMKSTFDGKALADLREYVSLCERMKSLRESGFTFPA